MNNIPIINSIAYGQNAEDIVLTRAFKNQPNGTYVDVGAGHPTRGSITKNLYDYLLFTGVEIEPIESYCDLLKTERQKNEIHNSGVGDAYALIDFYECKSSWAMSTFDADTYIRLSASGQSFVKYKKEIQTLDTILEQSEIIRPGFDLLKIDAEGYEPYILKGLNLKKWLPKVILIEATIPGTTMPSDDKTFNAIINCEYTHALFDGINSFFVHKSYPSLLHSISIPANKSDFYIPFIWWGFMSSEFKRKHPHLPQE